MTPDHTIDPFALLGGTVSEEDPGDPPPALGTVAEQDRGSLPFALIHGEALVACAAWALGAAGVTLVDITTGWESVSAADEPFVLHDALCPMTPASFLARCVRHSVETGSVVVGVRPVTDTVKQTDGEVVGDTVDRAGLTSIASPVVLPAAAVAELDALPSHDFAELVAVLAERYDVVTLEAPPSGRRVAGEDDVRVLEALTGSGQG